VFFDAGKVTSSTGDLNLDALKAGGGFGIRFHGPLSTPLRVDLAGGSEGLSIVWSASAAF
jgi:outer membrane translocation and assembly module TamA